MNWNNGENEREAKEGDCEIVGELLVRFIDTISQEVGMKKREVAIGDDGHMYMWDNEVANVMLWDIKNSPQMKWLLQVRTQFRINADHIVSECKLSPEFARDHVMVMMGGVILLSAERLGLK